LIDPIREEESKREREREVSKQREQEQKEKDRVLREVKREEYETEILTLLKEKIRDPEASWTKSKKILELEPRFAKNPLTMHEKEDLFRKHTRKLMDVTIIVDVPINSLYRLKGLSLSHSYASALKQDKSKWTPKILVVSKSCFVMTHDTTRSERRTENTLSKLYYARSKQKRSSNSMPC
jgi:hypothetical protein